MSEFMIFCRDGYIPRTFFHLCTRLSFALSFLTSLKKIPSYPDDRFKAVPSLYDYNIIEGTEVLGALKTLDVFYIAALSGAFYFIAYFYPDMSV